MSMKYTVNVARQVYRDVQESVFYKKELDTYPENIEKFIINLESLIYDKLSEFPFTGVGLSFRLDISTNIRYILIDDYILFYDVQEENKYVDVLRLLPAKSNWMNTIQKYL